MKISSYLALLLSSVLIACGGGGGGASTGANTSSNIIQATTFLGTKTSAGSFTYYRDGSTSNPVSYIFAKDINNDGVDEVFFVAFETQPNTQANYSNTSIHIFGWENSVFKEITSTWLPGTSNQVEGVGDLVFGDFNGDGKMDVFLSAYTDMDFDTNAYALMNTGSSFTKVSLGLARWQHGVASADVNRDGFDDVIVAGYANFPQYMGSATGLVQYSGMIGSSGVAVGDFLGTGTAQAVFVDASTNGGADSFIYSMVINNVSKQITFTKTVTLPAPRLISAEDSTNRSHDIRARAVDFDSDGRLDIVVISYKANYIRGLTDSEYKSEIQFIRNTGNGTFVDVTDSVRVGYDTTGYPGYYPEFRDFNGDGKLDLFLSQPDYFSSKVHKSTTLLIQQTNGTYSDTGKVDFASAVGAGGQGMLIKGPVGKTYLVTESAWARTSFTNVYIQPVNF
ncbi:MAG: VCBS repeat-containing protein [Burkholderiales bacterium]|nr:VCBS repeat-containing protein [Burkholderiales bacterium]